MNRSRQSQMFLKVTALKDFAIFTRKHVCKSLFLIKAFKYGMEEFFFTLTSFHND